MQALVVEIHVKAEHIAAFEFAIATNALASRSSEPGCRQFDVCRDPADASVFFLYELYDDDAAIEAHRRSAHFLHMNSTTASWVESKTVHRYRRQVP